MVFILATVGYQGRPQSVGCCLELGRKEGGNGSTGLWSGAHPAPTAGAELVLAQESFSKEEFPA